MNFYDILQVNSNATKDEIKKAFRKLAKQKHPDVGGDEEEFKIIQEAYETLSDDSKRSSYDLNNKYYNNSNTSGNGEYTDPAWTNYADMMREYKKRWREKQKAKASTTSGKKVKVNLTLNDLYNPRGFSKQYNMSDNDGNTSTFNLSFSKRTLESHTKVILNNKEVNIVGTAIVNNIDHYDKSIVVDHKTGDITISYKNGYTIYKNEVYLELGFNSLRVVLPYITELKSGDEIIRLKSAGLRVKSNKKYGDIILKLA